MLNVIINMIYEYNITFIVYYINYIYIYMCMHCVTHVECKNKYDI